MKIKTKISLDVNKNNNNKESTHADLKIFIQLSIQVTKQDI